MTLDLCVHVGIIASCSDCLVTGNQPKPVVVCVMSVALMVTKKVERHICIKFLDTHAHKWAVHKIRNVLGSSKRGGYQSRVMNVQGGLPQAGKNW